MNIDELLKLLHSSKEQFFGNLKKVLLFDIFSSIYLPVLALLTLFTLFLALFLQNGAN